MKRSILLFTALAGMAYLTLTSNKNGPTGPTGDRTGSPLSGGKTCTECHSGGTGITTAQIIVKDQLGNPVTQYKPGLQYDIVISGNNTTNLPKFGFQFVALKSGNLQAGTYVTSAPVKQTPKGTPSVTYVEHINPIDPVSGYNTTFAWFPPSVGSGTVTMYAMLNAVNNDNSQAGDTPSPALTLTLTEFNTSVSELSQNIRITAYPNPAVDKVSLQFEDAENGLYSVSVFDLAGRKMHNEELQVNSKNANISIPTTSWTAGMYYAQVMKDGAQRMIPVVKQ